MATIYNDKISIYAAKDGRGRFLSLLGFVQSDEITELANDTFSADVSMERVDLVDADVLVRIVVDVETDTATFAANPLYAALPVHTGGHDVFVGTAATSARPCRSRACSASRTSSTSWCRSSRPPRQAVRRRERA